MTQPTAYVVSTDLSDEEANGVAGRSTVRTAALDAELSAIQVTISQVRANMAALQRDDLKLIDRAVELHTISAEVLTLMGSAGFTIHDPIGWLTATAYPARDIVTQGTGTYVSVVAHASGDFATDLAAGKWVLIFDTTSYVANAIALTPTGDVAATNVQAGIAELASEKSRKDANLSDLASAATARANLDVPSIGEIQKQSKNSCVATGTVDAILGVFTPAITSLANQTMITVEATGANATATPTLKVDGMVDKQICRIDGSNLFIGDIPAANAKMILMYSGTLDQWMLLNPAYAAPRPGAVATVLTSNGPGVVPSYQAIPADANRIGRMEVWPGHTIPTNAFDCDGTAYSRTTYAALAEKLMKSETVTMTISSPCVITWVDHGLQNHMPFKAVTTGDLPTGLVAGRTYWIINKATNTFQLAAVPNGTAINTSGTQSGVHTGINAPHGDGDGSTTFNVPNVIDRVPVGYGASTTAESLGPAAVSPGSDAIAIVDNVATWITGMAVVFTTTGGAPTGLTAGNTYYVVRTAQNEIKLASSLANAQNGTVIDITSQGTGVHTITHTRPVRGLGEAGGEDGHAMSLTELLAHPHAQDARTEINDGGIFSVDNTTNSGQQTNLGGTTGSKGGNAVMNNMQPFIGERWIIYHS